MIRHQPIYGIGQQVNCSMANAGIVTIKNRTHNGDSWMYAFEETDLRCGEMYLQAVKTSPVSEKEIQELIKKYKQQEVETIGVAGKSRRYGNEAAYKEFMMQSFAYREIIADLEALLNKG